MLTNNWRAVFDPTSIGFAMFHARKVLDYSATFYSPTWRSFGGQVIWGGGHSATNYNGLTILTFADATMYFECLQTGTAWTGGVLDTGDNSSQCDATYGEATTGGSSPLKLAGPHSYGCADVVNGKLVQISGQALGYSNWGSTLAAHEIDVSDHSTSYSSRAWSRRTSSTGSSVWTSPAPGAPMNTRYVSAQSRIYATMRGGGPPYTMRWFDLSNNTWVNGTGTGFNVADGNEPNAGAAPMYIPSRSLLVSPYRNSSGNLVLEYADVSVSQPSNAGAATLSATLALPSTWGAIGWCPDNNRIHVFGVTGNTDKVYEIEIPSTLSNTWTVTAVTLPNSATVVPYVNATAQCAWGKGFDYIDKIKCFVHFPSGFSEAGNDVVQVYRPRNT